MELIYNIFYTIHIISGFSSLVSGFIAIMSKKGSSFHLLTGKIYYYSMVSVFITALIISIYKVNIFLLMIAIFSMYFVFVAVRVLKFKNKNYKVGSVEFMTVWIMIIVSILMIVLSFIIDRMSIVLLVFGIVGLVSPLQYIFSYKKDPKFMNKRWLLEHIGNIGGAYIATVTAFLVVNVPKYLPNFPSLAVWILPGIVGAMIIRFASKKYRPNSRKMIIKNA